MNFPFRVDEISSSMKLQVKSLVIILVVSSNHFADCESLLNFESLEDVTKELNSTLNELPITLPCLGQFGAFIAGLQAREIWAISIFDAWSKLQSGIFSGNMANFGHFDQCVRTRHNMGEIGEFRGQHCVTKFQFQSQETESGRSQLFKAM
jgi:hypothetical protein